MRYAVRFVSTARPLTLSRWESEGNQKTRKRRHVLGDLPPSDRYERFGIIDANDGFLGVWYAVLCHNDSDAINFMRQPRDVTIRDKSLVGRRLELGERP